MAFGIDDALIIGAMLLPKLFGDKGGKGGGRTIYERGNPLASTSDPNDPSTWSPYFQSLFNQQAGGGGGGGGGSASSTSTTTSDMSTAPFFTPEFAGLGGMVRQLAENRLKSPAALPAGYEASGIRNINQTYEGALGGLINKLSMSGYLGSPAAAGSAAVAADIPRAGQIADFRAQLPLMERQMRNEDIDMSARLLDAFGKGTRQKGKSTTNATTTSSGGGGGGGGMNPLDFTNMLKGNQYQQTLNQQGQGGGGWADWLSQLAFMFGSGMFGGKGGGGGGLSMPGSDYLLGLPGGVNG